MMLSTVISLGTAGVVDASLQSWDIDLEEWTILKNEKNAAVVTIDTTDEGLGKKHKHHFSKKDKKIIKKYEEFAKKQEKHQKHLPIPKTHHKFHSKTKTYKETVKERKKAPEANPTKSEELRFMVLGDWGGNDYPDLWDEKWPYTTAAQIDTRDKMIAVADQIGNDFTVMVGDNFYSFGVCGVDDERFKYTFEDVYDHKAFEGTNFYQTSGNHDWGNFCFWALQDMDSKKPYGGYKNYAEWVRLKKCTRNKHVVFPDDPYKPGNEPAWKHGPAVRKGSKRIGSPLLPAYPCVGYQAIYPPNRNRRGRQNYGADIEAQLQYTAKHPDGKFQFPHFWYDIKAKVPCPFDSSSDEEDARVDCKQKTVHILVIDSVIMAGLNKPDVHHMKTIHKLPGMKKIRKEQEQWLEHTLKNSDGDFLLIATHYPIASIGYDNRVAEMEKVVRPLALKYGVNTMLAGHQHLNQYLRDPKHKKMSEGIHYFGTGAVYKCEKLDAELDFQISADMLDGGDPNDWIKYQHCSTKGGVAQVTVTHNDGLRLEYYTGEKGGSGISEENVGSPHYRTAWIPPRDKSKYLHLRDDFKGEKTAQN